jgi:chemotaxis protein CheX
VTTIVPDELLSAFAEAVAVSLREMAGVEAGPRDSSDSRANLFAVLPVTTTAGGGYLALALPEVTTAALAKRILAVAVTVPDAAAIRDCAGEIVNVVAGQAKTLLRGTPYHFTLSTPRVEASAPAHDEDAYVIAFGSEVGAFELHVRLPV